MKLLLFATDLEARYTIERLQAKACGDIWRYDGGLIVVSGIGNLKAAGAVFRWAGECSEIVNLGIAGSLVQDGQGSVHRIGTVRKYLAMPDEYDEMSKKTARDAAPELNLESHPEAKRLISSDYPIFMKKLPLEMQDADLVDMEGYGATFAAKALLKPIKLIKVVSDFAKEGDRALIFRSLDKLAHLLSDQALSLVN